MTREEALELIEDIRSYTSAYDHRLNELQGYILNSIPTPTVEVEGWGMVKVNGDEVVYEPEYAHGIARNLRASLGIEVKP